MKTLLKILIAFFLFIVLGITIYFLYLEKIPINKSKHFFRNRLNLVFVDNTTGCLDICILKSYKKLPVNSKDFIVYPNDTGYAKDNDDVFYKYGEKIDADPQSFEVIGRDLAKDKHGYILYKTRLANYITQEIDQNYKFNQEKIEVEAYSPFNTIIISVENEYYLIQLNPQPQSIKLIKPEEVTQYLKK